MAINIQDLVKDYNNGVRALDRLNLKVDKGQIFSLLGPNGAGKSSLINILTTYYKATSGNIIILGKDLSKEPNWVRKQISCVRQRVSIDEHLSLKENMIFQSRLYKIDSQVSKERIESLIKTFNLSKYLKYPTTSYSGGVKRRLDVAMNMVSMPKILFLDEPTVGMDVYSRRAMWKMLLRIREEYETTIFLTTHYLEEAEQLSDTICIMKEGKKLTQGTPSSLRNIIRPNMISITFSSDNKTKKCKDTLDKTSLVNFTTIRGNSVFAGVDNSELAFMVLNKWLLNNNIEFNGIEIVKPSLEDVFLALTSSKSSREE
ncbi:MAG: ABC transporter ATP-binding protein [Firmicutes bacterium]|nr:ABC transporter ATP-binding protein [Bacillota bacterium]